MGVRVWVGLAAMATVLVVAANNGCTATCAGTDEVAPIPTEAASVETEAHPSSMGTNSADRVHVMHSPDPNVLTVEDARRALINLVNDRGTEPIIRTLSHLEQGERRDDGGFVVLGGGWLCKLELKTFVFSVSWDDYFYEISGIFEWDPLKGEWRAHVVQERET